MKNQPNTENIDNADYLSLCTCDNFNYVELQSHALEDLLDGDKGIYRTLDVIYTLWQRYERSSRSLIRDMRILGDSPSIESREAELGEMILNLKQKMHWLSDRLLTIKKISRGGVDHFPHKMKERVGRIRKWKR